MSNEPKHVISDCVAHKNRGDGFDGAPEKAFVLDDAGVDWFRELAKALGIDPDNATFVDFGA